MYTSAFKFETFHINVMHLCQQISRYVPNFSLNSYELRQLNPLKVRNFTFRLICTLKTVSILNNLNNFSKCLNKGHTCNFFCTTSYSHKVEVEQVSPSLLVSTFVTHLKDQLYTHLTGLIVKH